LYDKHKNKQKTHTLRVDVTRKTNTYIHQYNTEVVVMKPESGFVKAIPFQACRGPKDSRRLRLPDFKAIGIRRW